MRGCADEECSALKAGRHDLCEVCGSCMEDLHSMYTLKGIGAKHHTLVESQFALNTIQLHLRPEQIPRFASRGCDFQEGPCQAAYNKSACRNEWANHVPCSHGPDSCTRSSSAACCTCYAALATSGLPSHVMAVPALVIMAPRSQVQEVAALLIAKCGNCIVGLRVRLSHE